jgi:hypothetical protein
MDEPKVELIPPSVLPPLCEHCVAFYGNCEHHPMEAHRQVITKADLKKAYATERPKWRGIESITKAERVRSQTE